MTPRRLLLVLAVVLAVVNRDRIRAALIRWTGTNVHTERGRRPGPAGP